MWVGEAVRIGLDGHTLVLVGDHGQVLGRLTRT
jgi:hypothetical protein